MENSVIVQTLKTFSKEELRGLEKYLTSNLTKNREDILHLFNLMCNGLEKKNLPETEVLIQIITPKSSGDSAHLHHLKSYLMEAVENYLLTIALQNDLQQRAQTLTGIFRKRKLTKLAQREWRDAQQKLKEKPNRDLDYYAKSVQLEMEFFRLAELENDAQSIDLQPIADTQDIRFIIEKLQTGCLLLSQQTVTTKQYDAGLLHKILSFLEGHRYLEIPAVALYYYGYLALKDPENESSFKQLKNLLQTHPDKFGNEELRNLYLLAVNFCIRRLNQREHQYVREVFELYQSGLLVGAFLENGQLSKFTYTNIAQAGLRLKEYDWTAGFLKNYQKNLPNELREPLFQYNIARLYYETKRPNEAQKALLNMEHDDIIYNLSAKVLLAKIYYESEELTALDSLLDNISAYIRRKKVLGYHKDSFMGFTKIVQKMMSSDLKKAEIRRDIKEKIEALKVVAEKDWLLGKLM
jgi:hypothetical protein